MPRLTLVLTPLLLSLAAGCISSGPTDPDPVDDPTATRGDCASCEAVVVLARSEEPAEPEADPAGFVIGLLEMVNHEAVEGESETMRFVADLAEEHYETPQDGDTLLLEIWASDGASNPDFRVLAELTFKTDGVGAFISDFIDTSELLPWMQITVQVSGELRDGTAVEEAFVFGPGQVAGQRLDAVPTATARPIGLLEIVDHELLDAETETMRFVADLSERHYETPQEGDGLLLEIWASDGAPDAGFELVTELTYSAHGVGAFVTDQLDTSSLLPWSQLLVRVSGELRDGTPVDQLFQFERDQARGQPIG